MDSLVQLVIMAFAVAAGSTTITRAAVTRPLRAWVEKQGWSFIHEFLSCPYCMSHWLSALCALYIAEDFLTWLIITFALVGLSAIVTGTIFKLFLIDEHVIERLQEELNEAKEQRWTQRQE